jgi:hypothetical protein
MSSSTATPMNFPIPDSVGAGAAVIGKHVPSRPGRLQLWLGPMHGLSQQISRTQFILIQSLGMVQC